MMRYKGHTGSTEYCGDSQVWHGRILHTRDLVTYEAPTKELLAPEFARAVDDYIQTISSLDGPNVPPEVDRQINPSLQYTREVR